MNVITVTLFPLTLLAGAHAESFVADRSTAADESIDALVDKLLDKYLDRAHKVTFDCPDLNTPVLGLTRAPGRRLAERKSNGCVGSKTGGRIGGNRFAAAKAEKAAGGPVVTGPASANAATVASPVVTSHAAPGVNTHTTHVVHHHAPQPSFGFGGFQPPGFLSGLMLGNMLAPRPQYYGPQPVMVNGVAVAAPVQQQNDNARAFATVGAGLLVGGLTTVTIFDGDISAGVLSGAAASFLTWNVMGATQQPVRYIPAPVPAQAPTPNLAQAEPVAVPAR